MGQAKQRQKELQEIDAQLRTIDLDRVCRAIKQTSLAASAQLGVDCMTQTLLTQALLARLGVSSELRIGFSAWRIGPGDGDVISHIPMPGLKYQGPKSVAYHAWLQVGTHQLDVTTYLFEHKARALDALDGGCTQVDWKADYLLLSMHDPRLQSYEAVAQGDTGICFYKEDKELSALLLAETKPLDQEDFEMLWFVYQNPSIQHVIGPSSIKNGALGAL